MRIRIRATLAAAALAATLFSPTVQATETAAEPPAVAEMISLSGPRFGVTFLSPGVVDQIDREAELKVGSVVTQFGWQFEKRFYSGEGGLSGVTEWILLVGGMEHGVVLPSVNWMVGVRAGSGTEFGVGPNISPAGTAIVLAAGRTFRAGALNLPVNLAVVPSRTGVRVSLLCGFNTRRP